MDCDIAFYGSAAPMTRPQLQDTLVPILRQWIRSASIWKEAAIGDYRHLTFSVRVTPEICAFVQFFSEPLEPVSWEVCAGREHPPTQAWLAGERAAHIEALGFRIGGPSGNYLRNVNITTPKDVTAVAREVVDLFYDAFGYRGLQQIHAQLTYEGRDRHKPVYDAFTPGDIKQAFARLGFQVEARYPDEKDGLPILRFRKHGVETQVYLWERLEDFEAYQRIRFDADVEAIREDPVDAELIEGLPDDEAFVSFSSEYGFSGGVTLDWLLARIEEWDDTLAVRERMLANRPGPRRTPPASPGVTIH